MVEVWSDNFDTESDGTDPPANWEDLSGSPTFEVDDVYAESGTKSAKLLTAAGSGIGITSDAHLLDDDDAYVKFTFYSNDNGTYHALWLSTLKSSDASYKAVQVLFDRNSGPVCSAMAVCYYNGSSYVDTGENWAVDEWKFLKIVLDFTNNQFDLYEGEGEVEVGTGYSFYNNQSSISYIGLYTAYGGYDSWWDTFYMDDGKEPSSGIMILRRRREGA